MHAWAIKSCIFQPTLLQISMSLLYPFSSKQNKYRRTFTFTDGGLEKGRLAESMISVVRPGFLRLSGSHHKTATYALLSPLKGEDCDSTS